MRINLTTPMSDDKERERRTKAVIDAIEQYTEERMNDEYGKIHTDGSRSGGQPMPSGINQADIDAAESILWVDTIIDDKEAIAKAFARHRLAERAAIVAWLMREEDDYPSGKYSGFAAIIREEIEAGEHLK